MPGYLTDPVANAAGISISASGNISAVNVQDAIYELDSEKASDSSVALKAPLASPTFTGTVSLPTTNTSGSLTINNGILKAGRVSASNEGGEIQLARSSDDSTYWSIDSYGSGSSPSFRIFNSTGTVAVEIDGSGNPILNGSPTAPTASSGTNNTQIATTAFVRNANSGNVIQTIVTTLNTSYTRGSATAIADVTGFSASITPKFSNSQILILIQGAIYAICDGYWYIKRNGTQVGTLGNSPRIDFANDDPSWFYSYIDSPATTSQVTYQMSANATGCGQTIYVNSQGGFSRMILMEIQA